VATAALAQTPGDGISKYSVASETDPLAAMAFLQRYLGTTPTDETCQGNVCLCPESDAVQAFSQLPREASPPGTCLLLLADPTKKAQADRDTVAVTPSGETGKDCKYSDASKLLADSNHSYLVNAHSSQQCCKACEALKGCKAGTFMPSDARRRLEARGYEGFGLHFPSRAPHGDGQPDSYGEQVRKLEDIVSQKAGKMEDFDAFMDYNIGLWTSNMDGYIKKLDEGGVPYFAAKWPAPKENEEMYSLFVHVPGTLMFIELMSFFSVTHAKQHAKLFTLEQRLSDVTIEGMKEHPPQGDVLQPVKVSRAATDMEALDKFYVDGMQATKVFSQTRGKGKYKISTRCYQWPEGKADVCFVRRPDSATSGSFKVTDFEETLKSSAKQNLLNPHCNSFRWKDNHYAVDLVGDFEHVLHHIESDDSIKFQCRDGRLRYVFDPTGWGIKLNMLFSRCPYSCPTAAAKPRGALDSKHRRLAGSDPRCDAGECEAVDLVLPTCANSTKTASELGPNCTQCEQLVKTTCQGGMKYCHKCAAAHKPEWHGIGCAAAGCEESLEQLCRDAAKDDITGEIQMKFRAAHKQVAASQVSVPSYAVWTCTTAALTLIITVALVALRQRRLASSEQATILPAHHED
jgi:hypothetical protein